MAFRAKAIFKTGLIIVILGVVAYAVYWRVSSKKEEEAASAPPQGTDAEMEEALRGLFRGLDPIPVKATPTVLGTLVQTVHAEGRAQPLRQVRVTSQVSSILKRVLVKEGDYVRTGQVLLELDDEQYRLELEDVEAARLQANADYAASLDQTDTVAREGLELPRPTMSEAELSRVEERFRQAQEAYRRGRINEKEFQEAELDYQIARILAGLERGNILKARLTQRQIAVQRAERNLERTKVKAPFSGFIANLEVDAGEYVSGSTELCTLLDLSNMRVEVDVLESEIAPLEPGRKAEIEFTALRDEIFEGIVISVNPIIDAQTRTGRVTLELSNPEGKITAGMFARARIFSRNFEDVMMVPHEAIVERDERTLVFGVEQSEDEDTPDITKWRYVQLGPANDTHVVVLPTDNPHEGVRPGMLVLIEGHVSLQHDSPVKLLEIIEPNVLVP
jgi:RND family efflux transporter MFP subunit